MMKDYNYKICLIGMPGSGKTTIGKDLAKLMKYNFYDIDEMIKIKTDLSISQIFNQKGESFFRKLEKNILKELINSYHKSIISTGGGIIINNVEFLNQTFNIYLKCNRETLNKRLSKSKDRPLFFSKNLSDEINRLFIKREKIYSDLSDLTIDANGFKKNTLEDIIEKINK